MNTISRIYDYTLQNNGYLENPEVITGLTTFSLEVNTQRSYISKENFSINRGYIIETTGFSRINNTEFPKELPSI